ncbi:MAG: hypothetical protein WBP59_06900 [Ilumatobacteraceae bacterium]
MIIRSAIILAVLAATVAACGDDDASESAPSSLADTTSTVSTDAGSETGGDEQAFPDIIDVVVTANGDTFTFDVTVSSPYDTPERYADAWRIVAPDGTDLGVRELTHDHAGEQPFTRSLSGVEIPTDVTTVTVEGRDLANGWGGGTQSVTIEH